MKEKLMRRRRLVLGEESGDEMEAAEEVQWSWKREALQTTTADIKLYSRRAIVEQIAEELKLTGDRVYQEFLNSCFGFLMCCDTQGFCSRAALHCLFAREVIKADAGPDELWYHVGGRFIRFSKYEYALVTGLSFGPTSFDPSARHKPPAEGLFLRHYGGQRLKMETLRYDFTEGVFRRSPSDALKVAKLLIVYYLLFGMEGTRTYIDEWAWTLIEDTNQWETFMWGKYTYQILLSFLQRVPTENLHSVTPSYRVCGYIWAFLIWVFEAIPELGNVFGVRTSEDVIPRCLRWRLQKTIVAMGGHLDRQMEVHATLESSAEERRQPYWKHIHDDLRSGVCYIPPDCQINKRTLSINPSSRDAFPVSRPQGSKVAPTPHYCSTSANPMRFKKKRKWTSPLTKCASLRDEIPKRSARGLIQKKMPALVQQELPSVIHLPVKELFSQRCAVASTDPLSPKSGAKSSTCQLKCLKKDTLETNSSRFLKTDETRNIERLRTRPDFIDSELELPNIAVDPVGRNKLVFELNEKINEFNRNLENERLLGVYKERCKRLDIQIGNMGKEIEELRYEKLTAIETVKELRHEKLAAIETVGELRHEKLAAIKSVEEMRLKQLDVDKVVEELKRKNLEANLKLLESDKAVELYKSRLENLLSKRMKTEKRDNLDILAGGKYNSRNGSTPEDAENTVVMSRGMFTKSSELSMKGDRNSTQSWTPGEDDAHNAVKTYCGSQSRYIPLQSESKNTVKDYEHREAGASVKGNITAELDGLNDGVSTDDSEDESCTDSRMDDLITSLRCKSLGRKWTHEDDMLRALQEDEQLCMNAVCALYRQHIAARKSKGCSKNGGFGPVDSMSGCALSEYLIDGDGELRLRKSMSEVKRERPDVIGKCRKLATIYIDKLFQIYWADDDPFFSQS